jgi:hypothetical protein
LISTGKTKKAAQWAAFFRLAFLAGLARGFLTFHYVTVLPVLITPGDLKWKDVKRPSA